MDTVRTPEYPAVPAGRKPAWLRVAIPRGTRWRVMSDLLSKRGLHTVCDEAACPNKAECWGNGTATFMVLGDTCTRCCRFCAVATASKGAPIDDREPEELALAIRELDLRYAVITSVDRDDLPDRGAGHFARCVSAVRSLNPDTLVEVLIPDFRGDELDVLLASRPDVLAHNVETVRRLQGIRDARASFDHSLRTLREAGQKAGIPTKTSLILGLGETGDEVAAAMDELRENACNILVLGQYLQPTLSQIAVVEYVTPDRFERYAELARAKGFSSVVSGPLARTSYHAREGHEALASATGGSR
ncbi:MAG: lipoyl synthase [Spirochaetales bacterium]|nr:MAG: lipoyl synthase [Spirochaetales bacterium]